MQIKYQLLLTALCFVLYAANAHAFDKESFANSFYSTIQDNIAQEEVVVGNRISFTTSLPPDIVQRVALGTLSGNDMQDLESWCGTSGSTLGASSCIENLKNSITQELDLTQLESELTIKTGVNEIWANGTLKDSAFDLVVDLNIIDAILFGKEAQIPLALWSLPDGTELTNLSGFIGSRVSGSNDTPEVSPSPAQSLLSSSPSPVESSPLSSISTLDDHTLISSSAQNAFPGTLSLLSSSDNSLLCVSPQSVNYRENVFSSNTSSPSWYANTGTHLGMNPYNLGLDSKNITKKNGFAFWNGNGQQITSNSTTPDKTCNNSLYGGYYCGDSPFSNTAEESCDPFSGICKKCFGSSNDKEPDIQFCITWQFKTSDHSLFSSQWTEDSIYGYIKSTNQTYRKLLAAGPLSPKQEQNQGGFLTHIWDMVRCPGRMIYVQKKIPDQFTAEPAQKKFQVADIQNEWNTLTSLTKADAYNADQEAFHSRNQGVQEGITVREKVQALDTARQELSRQEQASYDNTEELNLYYKNVLFNLQNLVKIFETQFMNGIQDFPFKEIENLGSAERECSLSLTKLDCTDSQE